jgi:clan AA aspartic protease (TIGR02281 family)
LPQLRRRLSIRARLCRIVANFHKICGPTAFLLPLLLLAGCGGSPEPQTVIKMKKERGIFTIPCRVNGRALEFVLDTGASDVFISQTEAMLMLRNGYLAENDFIGVKKYSLANGEVEEGVIVVLREMEIGGLKLFNVRAGITHTSEAPLLLGQSALNKLGKIEIDYANNTLTIKNSSSFVSAPGNGQPTESTDYADAQYGIEMVFVKGGTFIMGCTPEQEGACFENEEPAHQVALDDFYIGRYEVTQSQWKAVMGANNNPSEFKGDNLPVENVSWEDAGFFIDRLNAQTRETYRLPTEAEWEYAARGGDQSRGYRYSGSNNAEKAAWHYQNAERKTQPAGSKESNELGIYDMSGNVYEWVSDWYGNYGGSPQTNPRGPSLDAFRVIRGGSWDSDAVNTRISYRSGIVPEAGYFILGFRLARGLGGDRRTGAPLCCGEGPRCRRGPD